MGGLGAPGPVRWRPVKVETRVSVTDKAFTGVAERPASAPMPALQPAPGLQPVPGHPAAPGPHSRIAPAVFAADTPQPAGLGARAAFLADLVLHGQAATPFAVGLFGRAGAGKSSLLDATFAAINRLAEAAEAAGIATPFLARTARVRIAVEPGRDPYATLLAGLHAGLAADYPALAGQVEAAFGDQQAVAHEASDRLSAARHRLDDERRKLDELSGRQARLVETVLFEGAGSRVDAYARANRGRIDRALRRFGFSGDTMLDYKEMVRDAAEPGLGRGLGWLSCFWAYRGQMRLGVVAVVFFVLSWLVGRLADNQGALLDALRGSNDKMGPVADWLAANAHWLAPVRQVLTLAGLAALAMNIVRALRFIQPVARGATLLRGDLDGRRHELDGLVAHQAQRVERVARDVEAASARATEAEQRAGGRPAAAALPLLAGEGPAAAAHGVFAALSRALVSGEHGRGGQAPARILVGLDGFERVGSREAAAFLHAAHQCFARPGFVTLLAADRDHLATGLAEFDPAFARAALDRMIQVPLALEGGEDEWSGARDLVGGLLRPNAVAATPAVAPDAGRSAFDKPWHPKEQAVLEALAPLAGGTPRAVKRFVNLYRVARADPDLEGAGAADLATLALGLALGTSGSLPPPSLITTGIPLDSDLQAARHAAETALGVALDLGRDSAGLAVARHYVAA